MVVKVAVRAHECTLQVHVQTNGLRTLAEVHLQTVVTLCCSVETNQLIELINCFNGTGSLTDSLTHLLGN